MVARSLKQIQLNDPMIPAQIAYQDSKYAVTAVQFHNFILTINNNSQHKLKKDVALHYNTLRLLIWHVTYIMINIILNNL